jgi:hypothetical protein
MAPTPVKTRPAAASLGAADASGCFVWLNLIGGRRQE